MLRRFWTSDGASTAIVFGLAVLPIVLAAGGALDYSRAATARTALQVTVDEAALAAAATGGSDEAKIRRVATEAVSKYRSRFGGTVSLKTVAYNKAQGEIRLEVEGMLPATFMRIVGIDMIPYAAAASALQAGSGTTEIALVLDNTWSMSASDATGVSKIDALKKAAEELVVKVKANTKDSVKIGLVPYADYVNVGKANRKQGWLNVPSDYTVSTPKSCIKVSAEEVCVASGPAATCSYTVDGVSESYDCTPRSCTTKPVPEREVCNGPSETRYEWFGCVGSRTVAELRLSDELPIISYPGILSPWRNCLNPIVPLTAKQETVIEAIRGMIVSEGGYRPSTFIPAGLIWGVNVLSPSDPFRQGAAYDTLNLRKAIVLMTDGENTLQFDKISGQHGWAATSDAADADSAKICDYAKSKKMEIFSVAFSVEKPEARKLLQGCASGADHYFEAKDSIALSAAFDKISRSLTAMRLSR